MRIGMKKRIQKLINNFRFPLLDLNISEMSLSFSVEIDKKNIALNFLSGYPEELLKAELYPALVAEIGMAYPEYEIELSHQAIIKAHQTQMPGKALRGVKNVIAVASGKGGVGKSTVAVNLASSLARQGARTGLLDADIYGPSIPQMLGSVQEIEIENDKYKPVLAHQIYAMSIGWLSQQDEALIWRGPMLAKALIQMLDITLWPDLDYLIIDLPPGTGDIQLSLVQKIPLTAAVIVTTPQTVATLDAQKAIAMFNKTNIQIAGLLENMAGHLCEKCGHHESVFGEGGAAGLCEKHHLPLLASLPLDRQIMLGGENGQPIAASGDHPLSRLYDKAALRLSMEITRNPVNYAGKFPKIILE